MVSMVIALGLLFLVYFSVGAILEKNRIKARERKYREEQARITNITGTGS